MQPYLSTAILTALSQIAILISANPLHRPFSVPLEIQPIAIEKDVVLSPRTPGSSLQPHKPPGIRLISKVITSGAVVYIVPSYRVMTDSVGGMLIEAYGILNDGIRVLGDDPILDHFTWLGRESMVLAVEVEKGQELLKSVLRDALTEVYDFMTMVGWMTASFTILKGKKEVGTARIGLL